MVNEIRWCITFKDGTVRRFRGHNMESMWEYIGTKYGTDNIVKVERV